jgi:hypothetical protein
VIANIRLAGHGEVDLTYSISVNTAEETFPRINLNAADADADVQMPGRPDSVPPITLDLTTWRYLSLSHMALD